MTGHGFDASDAIVDTAVARDRRMRAMSEHPTVLLAHGAWHGAWCWDGVVSRLGAEGLDVVAVDLPSVTSGGDMYDDARAVREVLDATPGDKVVVGHSYGGIVITEAAAGAEGVRHLV
jgi:pimeloyl-ACP methyl ester carboxylesterase